jgi:hypothetical protein
MLGPSKNSWEESRGKQEEIGWRWCLQLTQDFWAEEDVKSLST